MQGHKEIVFFANQDPVEFENYIKEELNDLGKLKWNYEIFQGSNLIVPEMYSMGISVGGIDNIKDTLRMLISTKESIE